MPLVFGQFFPFFGQNKNNEIVHGSPSLPGHASIILHTSVSAPKRFAKFGWQKQTFCGKKEEKAVSQTQVGQTIWNIYVHELCPRDED